MNLQTNQLIIKEKQTALRIFAFVMVVTGLGLYRAIGPEGSPMLIFTIVGLVCLVIASDLTVTADRQHQMLWLDYRSLFKHTQKEIPFAEIASIDLERGTITEKRRGHPMYRIVINLYDGQVVPFRSTFQRGPTNEKEELVNALRAFIGVTS